MPRRGAARSLTASAPVFAALGDEQRLRIVARLSNEGPLSIAELTAGANVTRQAITKHLHVLADAGLVRGDREGRENIWTLEGRRLDEARRQLETMSKQWDDKIERLRAFVED
jgi:DNA-binding transcriptional ArsR family regulator